MCVYVCAHLCVTVCAGVGALCMYVHMRISVHV